MIDVWHPVPQQATAMRAEASADECNAAVPEHAGWCPAALDASFVCDEQAKKGALKLTLPLSPSISWLFRVLAGVGLIPATGENVAAFDASEIQACKPPRGGAARNKDPRPGAKKSAGFVDFVMTV